MKRSMQAEGAAKVIYYILAVRPDEFALVPDEEGFVSIKELLRALHEEKEFSYLREGHLKELLYGKQKMLFEIRESHIRARERRWSFPLSPMEDVPRILYAAVRRRAHQAALEKGLIPPAGKHLLLSSSRDVALRLGRRKDKDPVILEILAESASRQGHRFYPFGDLILAGEIPPTYISGPPPPKDTAEKAKAKKTQGVAEAGAKTAEQAGSFFLDPSRDLDWRPRGKKQRGWKEEARRFRREKRG